MDVSTNIDGQNKRPALQQMTPVIRKKQKNKKTNDPLEKVPIEFRGPDIKPLDIDESTQIIEKDHDKFLSIRRHYFLKAHYAKSTSKASNRFTTFVLTMISDNHTTILPCLGERR